MGGDKFRDEYSNYFDGTDDGLFAPNNSNTFSSSDGDWNTITCWMKLEGTTPNNQRLWNMNGANPGFIFSTSGDNWHLGYNTGNSDKIGIQQLKSKWTGKWKHIIMSFQRNSTTTLPAEDSVADPQEAGVDVPLDNSSTGQLHPYLWIDGVAQSVAYRGSFSNSNEANHSSGDELEICSNSNGNNTQPFKGWISDLAVYKGLLFTNAQAKTVYNNREPFDHNSWSTGANSCTLWLRFGDGLENGSGNYVYDNSLFDNEKATHAVDTTGGTGDNSLTVLYTGDNPHA
jgi:hypothetical protein